MNPMLERLWNMLEQTATTFSPFSLQAVAVAYGLAGYKSGLQDVITSSCQLVYLTTGIPCYFTSENIFYILRGNGNLTSLCSLPVSIHQIRLIPDRVEADHPRGVQCEPKHVVVLTVR